MCTDSLAADGIMPDRPLMGAEWQYQVRIYLVEEVASPARTHVGTAALQPLENVLAAHSATLVSQLDAFERYVADAEREGIEKYPLYRWTKATKVFALHVSGREVYPRQVADALEAALQPLVVGGLVERLSRHDTNPANNLAVPAEYRS